MTKNPFGNAIFAALYIILIVFVIQTITSFDLPDRSLLIPIVMLSLFVLSAATMGFLFLYEPFVLYFSDQKQEAMRFFLKTLATFAGLVLFFVAALLSTSLL